MTSNPNSAKANLAAQFGTSLDNDDFQQTLTLLSADCIYLIGKETLIGPQAIIGSYQQNMIAGRKKLDQLVWGQSWVEPIGESEFIVNFTDYLTHAGQTHMYRCQQKLSFNDENEIVRIEHIENAEEAASLRDFNIRTGIEAT